MSKTKGRTRSKKMTRGEAEIDLARRLKAAWISHRSGISLDSALRQYCGDRPVRGHKEWHSGIQKKGSWVRLARVIYARYDDWLDSDEFSGFVDKALNEVVEQYKTKIATKGPGRSNGW